MYLVKKAQLRILPFLDLSPLPTNTTKIQKFLKFAKINPVKNIY